MNLDPQGNTCPPLTDILESPRDEMDVQEPEQVARNETNESFFRFIPSARLRKRPRSPTSEVTSLFKVSPASPIIFFPEGSYLLHLNSRLNVAILIGLCETSSKRRPSAKNNRLQHFQSIKSLRQNLVLLLLASILVVIP
jgi:hypothetical protein